MDWTDCPVIEVVPGKMSGAPVLRHSRVRPQDLVVNTDEGAEWLASAYHLPIDDVRAVLAFHEAHGDELPLEYYSPAHIVALGADIDWHHCALVEHAPHRLSGAPVIRGSRVQPIDLIAHLHEGAERLSDIYGLPLETVRSVISFYEQHKKQLAPAL